MRHLAIISGITLLLISYAEAKPVPAKACPTIDTVTVYSGYMTGSQGAKLSDEQLRTYVMGFVNGMTMSSLLGVSNSCMQAVKKCTEERSDSQLAAILNKHLTDHPEDWHLGLHLITYNALYSKCMHPHT